MNTPKLNKRVLTTKRQRGQGMTEYIIILALVAIAAIAVFSAFGGTVKAELAAVTNGLTGNTAGVQTARTRAVTTAQKANTVGTKTLGMDNYGDDIAQQ